MALWYSSALPESSFGTVVVNPRMRSAPSVDCPVGRSRFAGWLALALWSAGVLLALHVCMSADRIGWRQGLLLAGVLIGGAAAAHGWWFVAQGRLRWDGWGWFWSDGVRTERAGRLSVALDLQRCMLLRFRADDGAVCWLWIESRRAAGCWHELRCAAHARVVAASVAGSAGAARPHDIP